MKSMFYPATGEPSEIKPGHGEQFKLEELQGLIGGYIEPVCRFSDGSTLFANEEGKLRYLPVNVRATEMYHARVATDDVIRGPAVLVAKGLVT